MKINKSGTPDPAEKMRVCARESADSLGSQQKVPARIAALSDAVPVSVRVQTGLREVALGESTAPRGVADETFRLLDTHCRVISRVNH